MSRQSDPDEIADGTVVVSDFVRQFVRRHVAPGQRAQADLSLQPGGRGFATSHNLSLIPQSTRLPRPTKTRRPNSHTDTTRLIRPRKRSGNKRTLATPLAADRPGRSRREVPACLAQDLHTLWLGYARTVIDWDRLSAQATSTPAANLNLTNQLETVLRMNLVGARLRIIRSTSVPQAGRTGIVVLETKTLFRMVMLDPNQRTISADKNEAVPLRSIPKQGTVFLLQLEPLTSQPPGLVFSGDHLLHRPVDRAVRKWRRPVLPLRGLGDHLPSTAELMAALCCEPVPTGENR